jgi:hypothetical protein
MLKSAISVVETTAYLRKAERIMEDERMSVVDLVAADPKCGDLIPEGGAFARFASALAAVASEAARGWSISITAAAWEIRPIRSARAPDPLRESARSRGGNPDRGECSPAKKQETPT